jgi:alpha-amylase
MLTLAGDNATWTFNGSTILINGVADIDTTIKSVSPNAIMINNLVGGKEIVNLSFAYKGILPGKAVIQVSVDTKYNDKTMYLYSYNLANNRLTLVSSSVVVKGGIATFEATKGSDYILSETAIPGAVKEGWNQKTDGNWIFVKEENNVIGWIKDGTNWYKCDQSGIMQTKWLNDNGIWYYLNESGAMKTGWLNDNGTWYYLSGSGAMLLNTNVDGYTLGADGAWIQ